MKRFFLLVFTLALLLPSCGGEAALPADSPETIAEAIETTETTGSALSFSMPAMPIPATEANAETPAGTVAGATAAITPTTTITTAAPATAKPAAGSASNTTSATKTTATASSTSTTKASTTTTRTNPTTTATGTTSTTTTTTTTTAKQQAASVSFAIDGSAAVSYGYNVSMPARSMALNDGDSVLDLLKRSGVTVKYRGSGMTAYVEAINGLEEKACGGGSGWVYEINGGRVPRSCDVIKPENGDVIVWKYTLS